MPEFTKKTFQCRTTRPVRLYRNVYDTVNSDMVLVEGVIFYSRKQYINETTIMYCISESDSAGVPIGYWCPGNVLQTIYVEEEIDEESEQNEHDIETVDVCLKIKASTPLTYEKFDSVETYPNGLKVGDLIRCDQKVSVSRTGIRETRYRIAEVSGDDETLVGMWIVIDMAVTDPNGPTVTFHNNSVTQVKRAVMANRAATTADVTAGAIAGVNAGMQNVQDSNLVTNSPGVIPDASGVTFPDDFGEGESSEDKVISQINMNDPEQVRKLYEAYGLDYNQSMAASIQGAPIGRMMFVHGMPFQYTYITDRRADSPTGMSTNENNVCRASSGGDTYGRTFAREIAANMPIAVIAPGTPKFLTTVKSGFAGYVSSAGNDLKNAFIPAFNAQSDSEFGSILGALNDIEGDYQYYSIEINTELYYKYVNSLCRTSARLMGIGDEKFRGTKCADFDWGKYNTSAEQDFSSFERVMGLSAGVSFAYDPTSAVSDTITNTTTESQLQSMFGDLGSKMRDAEFILGYTGTGLDGLIDSSNYVNNVDSLVGGGNSGLMASATNALNRIKGWLDHSIHGMNMRFPEIWQDSQNQRSYDIDMHFITPYATQFCKWRYVLVPFFHLFALAAPRADDNSSQYKPPLLIRAFSKGYFNVEMGIIESITWKRFGDGDMISEDGVPTQIDVSISFKDLYHTLTMTSMYGEGAFGSNVKNFINNTGLMDLVGTLSGVNMNRITIQERISLLASSTMDVFGSMGGNFMRGISDKIRNITSALYYG